MEKDAPKDHKEHTKIHSLLGKAEHTIGVIFRDSDLKVDGQQKIVESEIAQQGSAKAETIEKLEHEKEVAKEEHIREDRGLLEHGGRVPPTAR